MKEKNKKRDRKYMKRMVAKEKAALAENTRRELVQYIKNLAGELGYTPTKADIPQSQMAIIKNHYTAWSKVITDSGLETYNTQFQQNLRKNALDERLKKLAEAYRQDPSDVDRDEYEFLKYEYYCNVKRQPEGFKPIETRSSKEEIKLYLQALAKELGYSPTMSIVCGAKKILKKYKGWTEALEDAGLETSDTERQWELREKMNDEMFRQLLKKTEVQE